jgi:hypothetical protein
VTAGLWISSQPSALNHSCPFHKSCVHRLKHRCHSLWMILLITLRWTLLSYMTELWKKFMRWLISFVVQNRIFDKIFCVFFKLLDSFWIELLSDSKSVLNGLFRAYVLVATIHLPQPHWPKISFHPFLTFFCSYRNDYSNLTGLLIWYQNPFSTKTTLSGPLQFSL